MSIKFSQLKKHTKKLAFSLPLIASIAFASSSHANNSDTIVSYDEFGKIQSQVFLLDTNSASTENIIVSYESFGLVESGQLETAANSSTAPKAPSKRKPTIVSYSEFGSFVQ